MSCTLKDGRKVLDVCHLHGEARYRYGKKGGQPELELSEWIGDLDYLPWNGIGRSIYEEVAFYNGDFRYAVYSAFDRTQESNYPLSGGIVVTNGDQTVAELFCDPGSVNTAIDTLYEQKKIEGFCWDYDSFSWRLCPS